MFGFSSGAALALAAAAHGLAITRLALFDLPLTVAPATGDARSITRRRWTRWCARGGAATRSSTSSTGWSGSPSRVVAQLRHAPFRPALEAMAHTLVYEATILGDGQLPLDRARAIRVPTLAIAAGAGPPFMRETAEALARAVPDGRALVLDNATHDLVPERARAAAPAVLRRVTMASDS